MSQYATWKLLCYLCGMPRYPWVMLHEYTAPVCRGCVNYEGHERIEGILEEARKLKKIYELTDGLSFGFEDLRKTSVSQTHSRLPSKRMADGPVDGGAARKMAAKVGLVPGSEMAGVGVSSKTTVSTPTKSQVTSSSSIGKGKIPTSDPVEIMSNSLLLLCTICAQKLDDTHFVQCPTTTQHKFCFPCSANSITKKQNINNGEFFCPSGDQCPLIGSNRPWAFMEEEISTILAKGSRDTKRSGMEH